MGNCQAIDAATLVIQHPCGKSDKLYWPVPAAEVMKSNPGHYVALLISSTLCPPPGAAASSATPEDQVRVTRIKLLRPTDTLLLGQVYRLITSKEVTKVLSAKKNAKRTMMMMRQGHEIRVEEQQARPNHPNHVRVKDNLVVDKQERQRRQQQKTTSTGGSNNSATGRSKTWQPSLMSISESSS